MPRPRERIIQEHNILYERAHYNGEARARELVVRGALLRYSNYTKYLFCLLRAAGLFERVAKTKTLALLLAARYRGGRGTRPPKRPTGSESPPRCEECGQAQRERSDRQPEAGEHKGRGGAQRGKGTRSVYGADERQRLRKRHPCRTSTPSTRRAGLPSRATRARRRGKPAKNSG